MRKKLLLLLTAMVLPLATWAADGDKFDAPDKTGGVTLKFEVISEDAKTCKISNGWGRAYETTSNWAGTIDIPATVSYNSSDYSVVEIGDQAFSSWNITPAVTSITIPNGITSIGNGAFMYTEITSITIPKSVTMLGGYGGDYNPFAHCSKLTTINLEAGISNYEVLEEGKLLMDTKNKAVIAGLGNVTIPAGTKSIADWAFSACQSVTTITVPESVTRIGYQAFAYCPNLETVSLPEGLSNMSSSVFEEDIKLSNVELPSAMTSLPHSGFTRCTSLTKITIPKNITSSGERIFYNCTALTDVTSLVRNPVDINEIAFLISGENTDAEEYLSTMTIPTGTTDLYKAAKGWNKIKNFVEKDLPNEPAAGEILTYTSDEGTLKFTISSVKNKTCKLARVKKYYDQYSYSEESPYEGSSEKLTIPSVVDGYTVTAIDEYALQYISNLKSIELPNTITYIGKQAFEGIWTLSSIISNNPNPTDVDEEAFARSTSWDSETQTTKTEQYHTTLFVPAGTKATYKAKTGWNKFAYILSGNEGKSFSAQTTEGVDVIFAILDENEKTCQVGYIDGQKGKTAISDYGDQITITIPASVKYNDVDYKVVAIGNFAFYGCYRVLSVNLPEGLKSIGEAAFGYCSQIPSIELPSTITSIGEGAFLQLNKLSSVNSKIETPFDIDENVFRIQKWNNGSYEYVYPELLYVPVGTKAAYEAKTGWNNFGTIEELNPNIIMFADDNVRQICVNAGWDTDGDSKISKDEAAAVTSISTESGSVFNNFEDNLNYTSFDEFKYFTGVTTIPATAFKWSLHSISIPKNVTTIENNAFFIGNLNTITVDEDNTAFTMNSGVLTSKDGKLLVRALKSATEGAFAIPNTVESIRGGAFYCCDNMTFVSIPNSVVTIEREAFSNCSGLTEITIPNSVTFIGAYAFAWTKVSSMVIPASVKTIYNGIFSGCYDLTDIYLPESDTPISLVIGALTIDNDHIATIHVPLTMLDDYALSYAAEQHFEAGKVVAKVTPANKYFTFSSGVDVALPEGVDAYKAKIVSNTQVGITKLTDTELTVDGQRVIKANNGVLLLGTAGTAYNIVAVKGTKVTGNEIVTTDAKSYGDDNQLEPVIVSKQFDANDYYVLSNNMFNAIDANSTNKVPACKAVLKKPAGVAATRSLGIGDGDTTGINEVVNETENDTWYNLQGSRVQTPTKKGIYIKNGKKVIIK